MLRLTMRHLGNFRQITACHYLANLTMKPIGFLLSLYTSTWRLLHYARPRHDSNRELHVKTTHLVCNNKVLKLILSSTRVIPFMNSLYQRK